MFTYVYWLGDPECVALAIHPALMSGKFEVGIQTVAVVGFTPCSNVLNPVDIKIYIVVGLKKTKHVCGQNSLCAACQRHQITCLH